MKVRSSEDINSTIRQFFCPNRTYNDMATLFFNPQEAAIHQLFHQDGEQLHPSSLIRSLLARRSSELERL